MTFLLKKDFDINFDDRNWYLARCRLSSTGIETIVSHLKNILEKLIEPPKKLLILDCDNTLWGGVVGEDTWSNLTIGNDGIQRAYADFKKIRELKQQGVLLALASKIVKKMFGMFKK